MEHTRLHEVFASIFDSFKPIHKMVELKSLWVSKYKKRYQIDDTVKITDDFFINTCKQHSTHKIVKLMGTLNDSKHEIHFEDLKTGEITIITL